MLTPETTSPPNGYSANGNRIPDATRPSPATPEDMLRCLAEGLLGTSPQAGERMQLRRRFGAVAVSLDVVAGGELVPPGHHAAGGSFRGLPQQIQPAPPDSLPFLLSALEMKVLRFLLKNGPAKQVTIGRKLGLMGQDDRQPSTELRYAIKRLDGLNILADTESGYRISDAFTPFIELVLGSEAAPPHKPSPSLNGPTIPTAQLLPDSAEVALFSLFLSPIEQQAVQVIHEKGSCGAKVVGARLRMMGRDGCAVTRLKYALVGLVERGILTAGYRISAAFARLLPTYRQHVSMCPLSPEGRSPVPVAKKCCEPTSSPVERQSPPAETLPPAELREVVLETLEHIEMPLGLLALEVALREQGVRVKQTDLKDLLEKLEADGVVAWHQDERGKGYVPAKAVK